MEDLIGKIEEFKKIDKDIFKLSKFFDKFMGPDIENYDFRNLNRIEELI